jgi:sialate O-acetylesterase
MNHIPLVRLLAILLPGTLPLPAAEFAPVFVSGAVLQRDMPVEIWGTGRDGEAVTVEIGGQSKSATAKDGRWSVTLDPMPAGEGLTLQLRGDRETTLSDIAVGEVWICSGQSNMEWRLSGCAPLYEDVIATANDPAIRELKVPLRTQAADPLPPLVWKKFTKDTARQFAAVPYFFAAELRQKLGVPVGLINCAFGGTPIEAWMDTATVQASGATQALEEHERKLKAFATPEDYEKAWQDYAAALKDYQERKKSGVPEAELGPQPLEPYGPRSKTRPGGLHENMLGVVRPYTARGVLWYQGENNAGKPGYEQLLRGLIASFRQEWKEPAWPFLIAQVSSPTARWPDDEEPYAILREAQRAVAADTPNAGLVVTLDHGEKGDVHPKAKQPVGERLARLVLGKVYGDDTRQAQSPMALAARQDGQNIEVSFDTVKGKLVASDPEIPTLEIRDETGRWQPATGEIAASGRTLRVKLPDGAGDVDEIRYAWRNFCTLSLYTDDGLPVSPWSVRVE